MNFYFHMVGNPLIGGLSDHPFHVAVCYKYHVIVPEKRDGHYRIVGHVLDFGVGISTIWPWLIQSRH